jgi:hypothetical protein
MALVALMQLDRERTGNPQEREDASGPLASQESQNVMLA